MASIFDRAKKLIEDNDEKIDSAAEKAGDFIDEKTKGKYSDKIDKAVDTVQEKTGRGDTTQGETTSSRLTEPASADPDTSAGSPTISIWMKRR